MIEAVQVIMETYQEMKQISAGDIRTAYAARFPVSGIRECSAKCMLTDICPIFGFVHNENVSK